MSAAGQILRSGRRTVGRTMRREARRLLIRHARARPREADLRGADKRVYIMLTTAFGMGGTIRATLNLAGYLAADWEVEIISLGRTRNRPFFGSFPAGVRVSALEDRRSGARESRGRRTLHRVLSRRASVLMHPSDRTARAASLWLDVQIARKLRRKAGFLITTRPGLNLMAADLRPPGLLTIGQEHMHFGRHSQPLRRSMAAEYGNLDALVVLTDADRRTYEKHLGAGANVVRIPNTMRPIGGPRSDLSQRTVLAIGRLSPQKGYDLLLEAWAQVSAQRPDWRLRICGRGPARDQLVALVRDHGLSGTVSLEGPVRDVGATMAKASIFALSSRFEGLPLVLLEAMAQGMAVVSFDCPTGPGDVVVDRRNGLLIPPKDVEALGAGMLALIEDEDLRRCCAVGAVETAREYSMDSVGPQWEALLQRFAPSA